MSNQRDKAEEILKEKFKGFFLDIEYLDLCIDAMLEFAEQSRITEQGELFKKVYIKSEADLPKVKGRYCFYDKVMQQFKEFTCPTDSPLIKEFLIGCEWYYQPITEQSSVVEPDKTKMYLSPSKEQVSLFIDGEWKFFRTTESSVVVTDEEIEKWANKEEPFWYSDYEDGVKRNSLIKGAKAMRNGKINIKDK